MANAFLQGLGMIGRNLGFGPPKPATPVAPLRAPGAFFQQPIQRFQRGLGLDYGGPVTGGVPGARDPQVDFGGPVTGGVPGAVDPASPGGMDPTSQPEWLKAIMNQYNRLSGPLDFNDPLVGGIVRGAESSALQSASVRGIQGGLAIQSGQRAYTDAAANLQHQRQQLANQLLGTGLGGAQNKAQQRISEAHLNEQIRQFDQGTLFRREELANAARRLGMDERQLEDNIRQARLRNDREEMQMWFGLVSGVLGGLGSILSAGQREG